MVSSLRSHNGENERTKCSDAKPNNQPTKANASEKNIETEADYLSAMAGE